MQSLNTDAAQPTVSEAVKPNSVWSKPNAYGSKATAGMCRRIGSRCCVRTFGYVTELQVYSSTAQRYRHVKHESCSVYVGSLDQLESSLKRV